jgi:protein-S-isoprenylcysteine O-methyltransferase Ste14
MISLALLIIRTQMEDKTLQNELEGYTEYTREVKYKILPGIW